MKVLLNNFHLNGHTLLTRVSSADFKVRTTLYSIIIHRHFESYLAFATTGVGFAVSFGGLSVRSTVSEDFPTTIDSIFRTRRS